MPDQTPLGFRFAGVACGLKKTGALDLALTVSDRPCAAAATFTTNRFPAAPVIYNRELLAGGHPLQAVAINTACANACTGEPGLADAIAMAVEAEAALGLPARSCAVMSTGVIGTRLPMDRLVAGLKSAAAQLTVDAWGQAARAIMTTDTRPKVAQRQVGGARILGMAKGSGMIHPNMATMLSVIVTDADIPQAGIGQLLREVVDVSFNCISVDGDTSTNDTVLLLANGAAGPVDAGEFEAALREVCVDLAQQVVRDGEGATKLITVEVQGAASDADAMLAAKAIANSPLVKTAFYGGDANWGRILCAVGYSGAQVLPAQTALSISGRPGSLQLVAGGTPLNYAEELATAIFAEPAVNVTVQLGLGSGQATVWTCDLSHEYVSINGHYRT